MNEIFLNNNELVKEEQWKSKISSLETDFNSLETNKERIKRILKEKILNSVKIRTQSINNFGILFSGGIDSSLIALICRQLNKKFTCYTIGIENSQDIEAAKAVSSSYNFNFKFKILTLEMLENTIKETARILKNQDIVWISVGAVLYSAGKLALQDNTKILFSGLGSEELFAGYERHDKALSINNFEALHKECSNGLKNMWKRDLLRDFLISKSIGIELKTPYLDLDLIKYSMSIHPMYKLNKENKKIILREVAEDFGLKKEFAWRKKKAAQYGSNFIKGLDKLANKHGLKLKKDYLKSLF